MWVARQPIWVFRLDIISSFSYSRPAFISFRLVSVLSCLALISSIQTSIIPQFDWIMVIIMILYDLRVLPAPFCYIISYLWKVESCVQIADCCSQLLLCKHACMWSRYSVKATVYLLTSRSLPSNGYMSQYVLAQDIPVQWPKGQELGCDGMI